VPEPRFLTAISVIFCVSGAALSNWFPRIPDTRAKLDLTYDELGIALFCVGGGAMVSMLVTGALIRRLGSRGITRVMGVATCAALPLIPFANSLLTLSAALLLFGALVGSLDVAMNAQAAHGENLQGRKFLNRVHGFFSVGTLIGAGMGAGAAALDVPLTLHLPMAAAILGLFMLASLPFLLDDRTAHADDAPAMALPKGPLWGLGIIAFCALLAEGAMADWSAIYLRDIFEAGPTFAAAGFGAFAVTMTLGRLSGDWIGHHVDDARLMQACGAALFIGIGLIVGAPVAPVALAGFAVVGAGISIVFPIAIRFAAGSGIVSPGLAIAAVATAGYTGLLAGPPLIGFMAERIGLTASLATILVGGVVIAGLGSRVMGSGDKGPAKGA